MERCNDTHFKSKSSTKSSRSKKYRRPETWEHRQERENTTSLCMERVATPYPRDIVNNISQRSVYSVGEIASLDMICVEEENPPTKEASTIPQHRIKRKKRKSKYTPKIDIFLCDDDEEEVVEETVNKLSYQTEKPMETEQIKIPRKVKHKKGYRDNLDEEKNDQASQGEIKRKGRSRAKLESATVNPPSDVDQESEDKKEDNIMENEKVRHHHRRVKEHKESAGRLDDSQKKKVRRRSRVPNEEGKGSNRRKDDSQLRPDRDAAIERKDSEDILPREESDDRKDDNQLKKVGHDRDATKERREPEDMMDDIQKVRKLSRASTTYGEEDIKKNRKPGEPRMRKRIKKDKQADADQVPHESGKNEKIEILTTSDDVEVPHRRSGSSKRGQSKKTKYEDAEYEEKKPKVKRAKKPIVDTEDGATKDLDRYSQRQECPEEGKESKSRKDRIGKKKHKIENSYNADLTEHENRENKKERKPRKHKKITKKLEKSEEHYVVEEYDFNIVNGVIIPKLDFSSFLSPTPSPRDAISLISYFSSEPEELDVAEVAEVMTFGQKVRRRWRSFKRACMKVCCIISADV